MSESEYLQRAGEYQRARARTYGIARTGFAALAAVRDRGFELQLGEGLSLQLDAFQEALEAEQVALDALRRASAAIKEVIR